MVNEFLNYSGYDFEARNKLLKIMNIIFEKEEVPNDFRKTLIETPYKNGDKSECSNCRNISLISVVIKFLSMMMLFKLRDTVDEALREEHRSFRKGRGCFDQIFTLRLIIEKCLSHQTPLVLSSIGYENAFDSADRSTIVKILSLYSIIDKYVKGTSAMYENNPAAVKVGIEISSRSHIKS